MPALSLLQEHELKDINLTHCFKHKQIAEKSMVLGAGAYLLKIQHNSS